MSKKNNTDDIPPAPELPPDLAEPEPLIDVHFAEENLDEVMTEHYGKDAAEQSKKRIYGENKK